MEPAIKDSGLYFLNKLSTYVRKYRMTLLYLNMKIKIGLQEY